MLLIQEIGILWGQLMLISSGGAIVMWAVFHAVKASVTKLRHWKMQRLIQAISDEREHDVHYLVNKLHAQNFIFPQGENLLYYAVKSHRKRAVQWLIQEHVPIEYAISKKYHVSVLSMAIVDEEPLEYIALLIEAGAQLDYVDYFAKTPLEYAQEQNRPDIIALIQQAQTRIGQRS